MLNYKQIWYGIKPIRWLNKFNLTERHVFVGDMNKKAREKYHGLNLAL